jgi:hypothetical protein
VLSAFTPVHRYRCCMLDCGYEFLRPTETAVAKHQTLLVRLGIFVTIVTVALLVGGFYLTPEARAPLAKPEVVD